MTLGCRRSRPHIRNHQSSGSPLLYHASRSALGALAPKTVGGSEGGSPAQAASVISPIARLCAGFFALWRSSEPTESFK